MKNGRASKELHQGWEAYGNGGYNRESSGNGTNGIPKAQMGVRKLETHFPLEIMFKMITTSSRLPYKGLSDCSNSPGTTVNSPGLYGTERSMLKSDASFFAPHPSFPARFASLGLLWGSLSGLFVFQVLLPSSHLQQNDIRGLLK